MTAIRRSERKPCAVADDHPLDATGDLALALGGSPDSWTGKVLKLLAESDDEHVARLAAGIPELVRAYRLWRSTERTPTAGEFLTLLDAALAEDRCGSCGQFRTDGRAHVHIQASDSPPPAPINPALIAEAYEAGRRPGGMR